MAKKQYYLILHLHWDKWEQKLKAIVILAFSTSDSCTMRDKNWTAKPGRNFITSFISQSPRIPSLSLSCDMYCWIWHPWLLGLRGCQMTVSYKLRFQSPRHSKFASSPIHFYHVQVQPWSRRNNQSLMLWGK